MRCRQCGHQNELGANFCSSCGSPLARDDEATLSLAELAERLELDEELGAALAELPEGMGMLGVRRGPNPGGRVGLAGARRGGAGSCSTVTSPPSAVTPSPTSSSTTSPSPVATPRSDRRRTGT